MGAGASGWDACGCHPVAIAILIGDVNRVGVGRVGIIDPGDIDAPVRVHGRIHLTRREGAVVAAGAGVTEFGKGNTQRIGLTSGSAGNGALCVRAIG